MALYRVTHNMAWDIPSVPQRKWSYRWFYEAPSAVSAAAAGVAQWTAHLRAAHRDRVYCYSVYASSVTEADDDYMVQSVTAGDQRGTYGASTGTPYLLKAVLSVTIPVAGSRPSRKFHRVHLVEDDTANGQTVTTTLSGGVAAVYDAMLTDLTGLLKDPDGQDLLTGVQIRLTTREFGRYAGNDVPAGPPL